MCTNHEPYKDNFDPGNSEREFFYETDWNGDLTEILKLVDAHFEEFHPDYTRRRVEVHTESFHTCCDFRDLKALVDDEVEFFVFTYKC